MICRRFDESYTIAFSRTIREREEVRTGECGAERGGEEYGGLKRQSFTAVAFSRGGKRM